VSSGFSEIGDAALQQEVLQDGLKLGIRLVGPNCLGVFNPHHRLDTFFLPHDRFRRPKKGNVAVVSQSGGLLICILEALALVGRGVSRGVNYGNAVDIDAPDIYEYLAGDDDTEVVVSYLESVGDGRRFVKAAKTLAARKPLLILKAGKGEGGQAAAYSHTGRLAGKYDVFSSILRQEGIWEAGDFDELLDSCHALSHQRPGNGNRICIITNAGGLGVLASDEASRQQLPLHPLPDLVRQRLHDRFPPFYCFGNPIDLTGQVKDEEYLTTLREIRDHYDGFMIIAHTGVAGVTLRLAEVLACFRRECDKPVVAHLAQGGITAPLAKRLESVGIPVYPSPERGIRALRALLSASAESSR
jgi:acyl-CoA synthetase (NDP forming)